MRFIALFAAALLIAPVAKADIFVWSDAHTGLSLTYPDTWDIEHNQQPDTILTIAGPDHVALPLCRVKAREDERFRMYPSKFESSVQKVAYARTFWEDYLANLYDDLNMSEEYDNAGLAQSFASYAVFSYNAEPVEGGSFRKGIGFASHYFDMGFIVECTATNEEFARWLPHFMNVIKSVNFKPVYGTTIQGNYRDFINKEADKDRDWHPPVER